MQRLLTTSLLLAVVSQGCASAPPAPLAVTPAGPPACAAWAALPTDGAPDALLRAVEADWALAEAEALTVLHGESVTSEERRGWFHRWVYVDPPFIVVAEDRFELAPALGRRVVRAAIAQQRPDLARLWAGRTRLDDAERETLRACLDDDRGSRP